MAKEDLLSKQINQLGYFLRKMIEKLSNADFVADSFELVSEINTELNEVLHFNFGDIEKLSDDEIIPFLLQNESFSTENMELFADILIAANSENFSNKALRVYEYINFKTATFSMERNLKIQRIKDK